MKSIRVKSIYPIPYDEVIFKFEDDIKDIKLGDIIQHTKKLECHLSHLTSVINNPTFHCRYGINIDKLKLINKSEAVYGKESSYKYYLSIGKSIGFKPTTPQVLLGKFALQNGGKEMKPLDLYGLDNLLDYLEKSLHDEILRTMELCGETYNRDTLKKAVKAVLIHYALTTEAEFLLVEEYNRLANMTEYAVMPHWIPSENNMIIFGNKEGLKEVYSKCKEQFPQRTFFTTEFETQYVRIIDYFEL